VDLVGQAGEQRGNRRVLTAGLGDQVERPDFAEELGDVQGLAGLGQKAAASRGSARKARARLMVIRTVEMVLFASPRISASWSARWVAAPAVE
jgi:hypothetical protein